MEILSPNSGKISFRMRMRLGIVLVIFLVTMLGILVSTYRQRQNQIHAMNELGRYIALNLSRNSVLGILSEEKANLEHPLRAALSDEQVLGAVVYSAAGSHIGSMRYQEYALQGLEVPVQLKLVGSSTDEAVILETTTTSGKKLRSYLTKVVMEKTVDDIYAIEAARDEFIGFVRIDMSLDQLFAKRAAIFWQSFILMPIYVLIGIGFSMGVEHRISRPLTDLKAAAVAVAKGDFSKRMCVETKDELGLLAQAFNNMSEKLSRTIQELHLSNKDLEKANTELNDFTYAVSHDLQEPLRKVHSFGQFLLEDCYEQLSEDGRDYIDRMQKASVKMKGLIQDLLKLSRVGTAETVFVPLDTSEIVNSALEDLAMAIKDKQAEIVVEPLPGVLGQNTLLTQLFENLIGNALKYRRENVAPRVEISAVEQDGQVTFSIKDNGIGIEERFLEKIFGVFQRLHNKEYEGAGIGLALCRKIVRRHGGGIWAESTLGEGTTFYFTLKSANVNTKKTVNDRVTVNV